MFSKRDCTLSRPQGGCRQPQAPVQFQRSWGHFKVSQDKVSLTLTVRGDTRREVLTCGRLSTDADHAAASGCACSGKWRPGNTSDLTPGRTISWGSDQGFSLPLSQGSSRAFITAPGPAPAHFLSTHVLRRPAARPRAYNNSPQRHVCSVLH